MLGRKRRKEEESNNNDTTETNLHRVKDYDKI